MELRQLVYFEAVVRCGGFTRAAEHLRVAQPAISAQIRRLEGELGVALLTRTSRQVATTEAGRLLLARARRVLAEIDAARADAVDVGAVLRGHVTVGATEVLGGFDLPGALSGFSRRYPGVTLSLRTGLVSSLVLALTRGDLDLVLGPIHADVPTTVRAHPLVDDRWVLVTAPGRGTGDRDLGVADLAGRPFVSLPSDSGLRQVLDGLAVDAGVELDVRFEASTPGQVRELVAADLGVALMTASSVERPGPRVDVFDLRPPTTHPKFGVLDDHVRTPGPAARALREHLTEPLSAPDTALRTP